MKKNYILDTNVLLHDPQAIFKFQENNVIIPIYVIEEIDQFKKDISELGRSARHVARTLDSFRVHGHLGEGVPLNGGGILRVAFTQRKLPAEVSNTHVQDNSILAVALDVRETDSDCPAIFITKDVNLRIRADVLGLQAEDYKSDMVRIEELYSGWSEIDATPDQIRMLHQGGWFGPVEWQETHYPNEFLQIRDVENPNHTVLGRVDIKGGRVVALSRISREGAFGIRARNREQHFAFDLLVNEEVKLVTLVGKAGTGKTLLALAAGLHKLLEEKSYHKMLVSRPIFPLGRDLGYLPGKIEDKLNPWMQPIYDNMELLMDLHRPHKSQQEMMEIFNSGLVEIEPLTYIRGRSIPHHYIIVDEAQNLTPHEVKTILTRVGSNTKIVFTGDPYQIDNPYVDSSSNGLTYLANRFKEEEVAGHITMNKGERSNLAELAANLL